MLSRTIDNVKRVALGTIHGCKQLVCERWQPVELPYEMLFVVQCAAPSIPMHLVFRGGKTLREDMLKRLWILLTELVCRINTTTYAFNIPYQIVNNTVRVTAFSHCYEFETPLEWMEGDVKHRRTWTCSEHDGTNFAALFTTAVGFTSDHEVPFDWRIHIKKKVVSPTHVLESLKGQHRAQSLGSMLPSEQILKASLTLLQYIIYEDFSYVGQHVSAFRGESPFTYRPTFLRVGTAHHSQSRRKCKPVLMVDCAGLSHPFAVGKTATQMLSYINAQFKLPLHQVKSPETTLAIGGQKPRYEWSVFDLTRSIKYVLLKSSLGEVVIPQSGRHYRNRPIKKLLEKIHATCEGSQFQAQAALIAINELDARLPSNLSEQLDSLLDAIEFPSCITHAQLINERRMRKSVEKQL